jgi:hypothetical protein
MMSFTYNVMAASCAVKRSLMERETWNQISIFRLGTESGESKLTSKLGFTATGPVRGVASSWGAFREEGGASRCSDRALRRVHP